MEGLIDIQSLSRSQHLAVFGEAITHVPDSDVACFRNFVNNLPEEGNVDPDLPPALDVKMMSDTDVRGMMATLRYQNAICDGCWKKGAGVKLLLCSKCKLTFYCGTKCRDEHAKTHAKRCCKPDGPLDEGPQKIAFVPIKKK